MAELVYHEYKIRGELEGTGWTQLKTHLGELALHVEQLDKPPKQRKPTKIPTRNKRATRAKPDIPRTLDDVISSRQFVGIEHMYDHWKDYRHTSGLTKTQLNRTRSVDDAWHGLVYFTTEKGNGDYANQHERDMAQRKAAGLNVVHRKTGEPYAEPFDVYEKNYYPMVLQISGLVRFMGADEKAPPRQATSEELLFFNPAAQSFTESFVNRLTTQIRK